MAYNKNLYTSSTDALDAGIIYDSNITKMQSEINAMLNKYMVIIGEATFDEEAVDPQTSQTTQYYDFSPESGSSDTINLVDGDVVLIKFPQAHPFLTTNHNRIWILTNAGYTSYLVSGGDVAADRAYQTHFAFKFNGTFLIPFDINGAQEHYNELKTSINNVQTVAKKVLTGKRAYILGDSLNANGFGQYVLSISGMVGQSIGNGSTGFITVGTGNKRFSDLLSDLASSLSTAEKNSTDYFILMGGINDALNGVTASTEKPAVVSFISSAKSVFPNAEIIICPLHTFKWLTPTQYNCYSAIIDACRENGVRTTEDFLWWTIVDDYRINSGDDVHLTSSGYQILGGLIVNFIMGGDVLKTWTYGVESSIGTVFSNVLTRKGRHFYWRAVITQITTSDITRIAMTTTSADSLKNMTWAFSTFLYGVLYYNSSYYPINSALERKSGGSGINLYTRVIAPNPPSSTVGGSVWFNGSWEVGIDEDPTR